MVCILEISPSVQEVRRGVLKARRIAENGSSKCLVLVRIVRSPATRQVSVRAYREFLRKQRIDVTPNVLQRRLPAASTEIDPMPPLEFEYPNGPFQRVSRRAGRFSSSHALRLDFAHTSDAKNLKITDAFQAGICQSSHFYLPGDAMKLSFGDK